MRRMGPVVTLAASVIVAVGMLLAMVGASDATMRHAFVGTWNLVGIAWDDESMAIYDSQTWLELRADGTATYEEPYEDGIGALGDVGSDLAWTASSESTATIDLGGRVTPMLVSGERLSIETDDATLTFERAGAESDG